MDDNPNDDQDSEMEKFSKLVALFGPKKASDIYFVWNIIKIVIIVLWLFWCCS